MKKAITILAVLAIVVGAVFAVDPVDPEVHSIRIKSTVERVPPKFQMVYSITTSEPNFTKQEGTTNNDATKNDWSVQSYVDTTAKEVSDISKYNITGTFTAKVITDVKLMATDTQTYKLTWKAEPLTQTTDIPTGNDPYVVKASLSSTLGAATGSGAATVKAAFSGSSVGYNVITPAVDETPAVLGNDLVGEGTVQFGVQNNTKGNLAVFTVEYPADSNAPAADYYATISLSIASDS